MELRKSFIPMLHLPTMLKRRLYDEAWQKEQVEAGLRDDADALVIRTKPLPYLEILYRVANKLPVPLQVYGVSAEIWLGKPVVQSYSYVSEQLRPEETRDSFRAITFLNPFQMELLNPAKKDTLPPNVTVILTVACRSSLGHFEKSVRSTWVPPRVVG